MLGMITKLGFFNFANTPQLFRQNFTRIRPRASRRPRQDRRSYIGWFDLSIHQAPHHAPRYQTFEHSGELERADQTLRFWSFRGIGQLSRGHFRGDINIYGT
jgi:hypothetical protein